MNIRNVLRTYSLLRQLTDDESALLETLRGLNDAERESLVVALQPEKTTTKRASKKSNKSASKSARASGMAAAINRSLEAGRQTTSAGRCTVLTGDGVAGVDAPCNALRDDPIHDPDGGYLSHHPFVSAAPPARGRSSTNGGAGATTQNIETEREDVSNAVHAGD